MHVYIVSEFKKTSKHDNKPTYYNLKLESCVKFYDLHKFNDNLKEK